jgi:hypothetical protein
MIKIEIVSSDHGDWEGLYINDKLVAEEPTIRPGELLFAIKEIFPHTFEYSFVSDEYIKEGFPEDHNELVDYIMD